MKSTDIFPKPIDISSQAMSWQISENSVTIGDMKSLCYLLLLISSAVGWKSQGIDWEAEILEEISHFDFDYGIINMEQWFKDIYADGFVAIFPHRIIKGDFEGKCYGDVCTQAAYQNIGITFSLAKHMAARRAEGQWLDQTPHIVSTCDNTAVVWAKVLFINVNNATTEGCITLLYEHVGGRAKARLIQGTA